MANSTDRLQLFAAAVLASALNSTAAQEDDPQPISLDAESSLFDRQTNRVEFQQLTISQGDMSISADEAIASGLDFEEGEWRFTGNVTFTVESARIDADSALMTFVDNELQTAELIGDPATLEDAGDPDTDPVRGGAARLVYDNAAQTFMPSIVHADRSSSASRFAARSTSGASKKVAPAAAADVKARNLRRENDWLMKAPQSVLVVESIGPPLCERQLALSRIPKSLVSTQVC